MSGKIETHEICCAALELSKSTWVCAFLAPRESKASVHSVAARDIEGLVGLLNGLLKNAEQRLSRPLSVTVCHEAGYDGFWIARSLVARGIPTIVFDPASFLRPRRARVAKTDRLDAEGMCRTLRTWLTGEHSVASSVRIQSVEEEDAKRLGPGSASTWFGSARALFRGSRDSWHCTAFTSTPRESASVWPQR